MRKAAHAGSGLEEKKEIRIRNLPTASSTKGAPKINFFYWRPEPKIRHRIQLQKLAKVGLNAFMFFSCFSKSVRIYTTPRLESIERLRS